MNRKELMEESKRQMAASVPRLVVHILVAGLIWLFGELIFVPLARSFQLFGFQLAPIISAIVLVALLVVLVRAALDIRRTADALAGAAAVSVSKESTVEANLKNYRTGFRGLFYVLFAVLIYLFFAAFLTTIHPVAAGVVLVVLVIWSIIVLVRVADGFSRGLEDWSRDVVHKAGERVETTETGVRIRTGKEDEEAGTERRSGASD